MSTVIAINPFEVRAERIEHALALWDRVSAYFSRQPGFVSARLHRALEPNARFALITVAEWESAEHFLAALSGDGLAAAAEGLDEFPHFPSIYQVVRS